MKAALRDGMYCMPLAFAFPNDAFARQVEDEVMIGESLLIAPDRKSTRLNSSHNVASRMPSSA